MDDPAQRRLWLMTGVRLLGVLVVIGGLGLSGSSAGDAARMAGGLGLMAAGAAISLVGPKLLLRRWRR